MRYYYLPLLILLSTAVQAQKKPRLAKTIDSLYQEDQAVQLKLKAMSERQAPKDSLKLQDSLKKQTYLRGLQAARSIFERYGYPTSQLVGTDAAHHFFVLIQHADSDPQFQVAMLPVLDKQSRKGNIARKDYAYLYDRVQRNTGGKQLYGTQLSYDKTGNLFDSNNRIIFPADLADPQHVDERRKEVGWNLWNNIMRLYCKCLADPERSHEMRWHAAGQESGILIVIFSSFSGTTTPIKKMDYFGIYEKMLLSYFPHPSKRVRDLFKELSKEVSSQA